MTRRASGPASPGPLSSGLVLAGGCARGAYQAGVLKRIGEIRRVRTQGNPFAILAGASAGAANAYALAIGSHDFFAATRNMAQLWSSIRPSDVFRCDMASHVGNSLTWLMDLCCGAIPGGGGRVRSLLDPTSEAFLFSDHKMRSAGDIARR